MSEINSASPVAIVGIAAIMPEAPDGNTFWANITAGPLFDHRGAIGALGSGAVLRPDHSRPDKTYSKIGGWVRELALGPDALEAPHPAEGEPTQMDDGQKWAISAARSALLDAMAASGRSTPSARR
jgi:acyl transferase domain-containing protein